MHITLLSRNNFEDNCFAGTLLWSINEKGQIQPCGVCSMDEFAMGEIDQFDDTILTDRKSYVKKVKGTSYVKAMEAHGAKCPFSN